MWYVSQKCRIDQYDTFGISILECLGFSQKCHIDQYDTFGKHLTVTIWRNFFQTWYIGKYDIASLLVKAHVPYYNVHS